MSVVQSSEDNPDHLADSNYSQSYESPCESNFVFGQTTEKDFTSPKKRKIDKDGFLCPATPDIPITSCHYRQPRHNQHESQEPGDVRYEQSYETPEQPFERSEQPYETPEQPYEASEQPYEASEQPYEASEQPYESSDAATEDLSTQPNTENQLPLDEVQLNADNKDRTGMPIDEVIKDLGQESKMLYGQWANMFRESENFETFCPVRLDKMIQQAKELEESLLKQKQLLCTRLNVISHIIRTSITEGPGGDH